MKSIDIGTIRSNMELDTIYTPRQLSKRLAEQGIKVSPAALAARLMRWSHDGKIIRVGHGTYRKAAVQDLLEGKAKTAIFGVHGLVIRGQRPNPWPGETPTWSPHFDNHHTETLTYGQDAVTVRFEYHPNGTLMIQLQGGTDNPLSPAQFVGFVAFIEGHLGPMVHSLNLTVVEIGINTDLGEWSLSEGGITLSPWSWGKALLRIYEHEGCGLRIEAHINQPLDLKELVGLLKALSGGAGNAERGP